jgi:Ca2+-binding EF-hand superfamily protein
MNKRYIACAAALAALTAATGLAQAPVQQPPPRQTASGGQQPGGGPTDARSFIQQFDRNRDSALTRDEVSAEMRDDFDQIDRNRDGRITADELEQAARQAGPPPSEMITELVFAGARDERARAELQRIYVMLLRLDTTRDGQLSAQELQAGQQSLADQRLDAFIQQLDTNRDGRIARQEARGPLGQDFDRVDRNRDGFIDREELRTAPPPPQAPGSAAVPPPQPGQRPPGPPQ